MDFAQVEIDVYVKPWSRFRLIVDPWLSVDIVCCNHFIRVGATSEVDCDNQCVVTKTTVEAITTERSLCSQMKSYPNCNTETG